MFLVELSQEDIDILNSLIFSQQQRLTDAEAKEKDCFVRRAINDTQVKIRMLEDKILKQLKPRV